MFADPTFWVAIGFLILIGLMVWFKLFPKMGSALDERSNRIKSTLDEAAQLREEAQHLLAEYQRKQRDAVKETEELIEHAKQEAERLAASAAEDLETALKRREQLAVEKIAQAEAEALAQVRAVSVDVALAATGALIASRLDESRANELIDQAIDGLADNMGKLH